MPLKDHEHATAVLIEMGRINQAVANLKSLGWNEMRIWPGYMSMHHYDGVPIEVLDLGSVGIHEATWDRDGMFWMSVEENGDSYPLSPILWRQRP